MVIVIADQHPNLRSALRLLIDHEPGLKYGGEAVDAIGLREVLRISVADVALVDWQLSGVGSRSVVRLVRDVRPTARVIVMGSWTDDRKPALAAGADAFIGKGYPARYVLDLLRHLQGGEGGLSISMST